MNPPRRVAWWWLTGFAVLALVLMLALTPWGAVVGAPEVLVRRAFGPDLVARGNAFAAQIRPATYVSLVVGLVAALWLGLSRRGLRLVRAAAARLRWWWLQTLGVVAVAA